ncbi:phosphoenolpyruvate--protein phosphotransferase [Lichenibacterium dinghuense]|uniref:phosphoenolpyruvate--protein phosphotransferase n=1 Tax=Lichenibacterium dinghuense TaxID=2895977 RepID=UPI001F022EE0|nr:phosphoenolpyruvate--protein phosphotransferase [Lichenibacterium sp. 6Y81]
MERTVAVACKDGLHARPAAEFAKLAKTYVAEVSLRRPDGAPAKAKSAVKLMLLAVKEGEEVVLEAEGDDAEAALDALSAYLATHEAGTAAPTAGPAGLPEPASGTFTPPPAGLPSRAAGVPASEGAGIGPAFPFFPEVIVAPDRAVPPDEAVDEVARLHAALDATTGALIANKLEGGATPEDVGIIDALIEVARDAEFVGAVEAEIRSGRDAVTAVLRAGGALAASFERVEDDYIRARAEDVGGVTRALALSLLGRADADLSAVPEGAVLVADEVSAWDFTKVPAGRLAGIVCTQGAATSHLAIMARTHGVPAVLGWRDGGAALRSATRVALDGSTGDVWVDPDAATAARIEARVAGDRKARAALAHLRGVHPATRGGRPIEVAANLGSLKEIGPALEAGAMGVGLFRTELLFMERKSLPSEDEQARTYAELARAFAPHPVVVRTLDIGGDKPVAGIAFPHEDNPFLGWRGVRMCLDRPDVFKPQIRALLRAALSGNVKVMVPMVSTVDEVLRVKALVAECRAELDAEGAEAGQFELGIMVETPAAALMAGDLARHVAFFSIGTNDLTQYVMASDRLNPRVADLNRADQPAVLRAVEMVCAAAREAGIWVGICGEAAARVDLIPTFLRYGVGELSMSPASIPRAKAAVMEAE